MQGNGTKIRLIAAIGTAAAVAALGVSSSASAATKPKPICAAELVSLGLQGDRYGLELFRRTVCGRRVGPAFG